MNPIFALLYNRLPIFAKIYDELENHYYKFSHERLEMARLRLAAHELSMKEGYQSPYTDPDDYDSAWRPLVKRRRKAT